MGEVTACFGHLPYPCAEQATNAATLHQLAHPACEGVAPWQCTADDHWHIGHHTAGAGHRCKTHPDHQATSRRLARARRHRSA